jgi:hypothetical protein
MLAINLVFVYITFSLTPLIAMPQKERIATHTIGRYKGIEKRGENSPLIGNDNKFSSWSIKI